MKQALINISQVTVKRGGRIILEVESLQVSPGELIGIIGTNGAGKTTLLRLCCGLVRPSRGRVELAGSDLAKTHAWRKSILRKQIGYVPQAFEYHPELPFTLREVVAMGRTSKKPLFSRLSHEDFDQVDYWLAKLGLAAKAQQTFRSLSGGEQQKALIAQAMTCEPAILMLDEPGANLDFNWKTQLTRVIGELYQELGITILMVSHETSLLPAAGRRVVLMHEGNIIADGPYETVLSAGPLEKAYQCPVQVVELAGQKYAINKSS